MNKFGMAVCALSLIAVVGGCAPQLAPTPLSETEQGWADYLKTTYPSWKHPQTTPPQRSMDSKEVFFSDAPAIEVAPFMEGDVAADAPAIEVAPPSESHTEIYVSQKGDSLWIIAQKFYKNGSSWTRIRDANKDILPDPKKLKEGTKLRIPLP